MTPQQRIEHLYGRHFSCIGDAIRYHAKESMYLRQLIQHHGISRMRQIWDRWEAGQTHQQIREWMGLSYSPEYLGSLITAARYQRLCPADL